MDARFYADEVVTVMIQAVRERSNHPQLEWLSDDSVSASAPFTKTNKQTFANRSKRFWPQFEEKMLEIGWTKVKVKGGKRFFTTRRS
jgi:hypothetical protein